MKKIYVTPRVNIVPVHTSRIMATSMFLSNDVVTDTEEVAVKGYGTNWNNTSIWDDKW